MNGVDRKSQAHAGQQQEKERRRQEGEQLAWGLGMA